jgi:hypothetical protein
MLTARQPCSVRCCNVHTRGCLHAQPNRDFTNTSLPCEGGVQQPAQTAAAGASGMAAAGGGGQQQQQHQQPQQHQQWGLGSGGWGNTPVLLVYIDNVVYPPTLEALHTVCSAYGQVQRMTVFQKNDNWQVSAARGSRASARGHEPVGRGAAAADAVPALTPAPCVSLAGAARSAWCSTRTQPRQQQPRPTWMGTACTRTTQTRWGASRRRCCSPQLRAHRGRLRARACQHTMHDALGPPPPPPACVCVCVLRPCLSPRDWLWLLWPWRRWRAS